MTENEAAKAIVNAACKIHITPGPGLLESVTRAFTLIWVFEQT
jgi:hypothetical protein